LLLYNDDEALRLATPCSLTHEVVGRAYLWVKLYASTQESGGEE
jgi:hypothetical protein